MSHVKNSANDAVKWLMAHPMMRGDQPLETSVEFLKLVASGCIRAASCLDPADVERMSQEMVFGAIRTTYAFNNELPKMIGEALGKDAVLVAIINADGSVIVIGDHRPNVPNEKRNGIMLTKMGDLLGGKMKEMMQEAAKEARDDDGCAGCLSASDEHPCLSHGCKSWCRQHYMLDDDAGQSDPQG